MGRLHLVAAGVLVAWFANAEAAMADDTPEVVALKAAKAKAEVERDLAKTQLEKLQAERQLKDAEALAQASAAKTAAEAQTAVFTQQKAAAEAQSAELAAEAAAVKARYGSVAGNAQVGGTVTADAGAGGGEASLLAALAVDEAATHIASGVCPKGGLKNAPVPSFVIFAGTQRPSFGRWRAFRTRLEVVEKSFDHAGFVASQADQAAKQLEEPARAPTATARIATESVAGAITGAGAVLDLGAKLGSYFLTDYKIGPVAVIGSDDDLLAVSVAGQLAGAWYPARYLQPRGDEGISSLLKSVSNARTDSVSKLKEAQEASRHWADAALKDAAKRGQYQAVAAAYDRAVETYAGAQKSFDDLLTSLSSADANGIPLVAYVIDEKLVSDRLEAGAHALFVHVNTAAGGYYTKKNLWTFLGTMPFYVMGGAIVSYLEADGKSGEVMHAGQFAIHSGYTKVSKVPRLFRHRAPAPAPNPPAPAPNSRAPAPNSPAPDPAR